MAQIDTGLGWSAKEVYAFSAEHFAMGSLSKTTSEFFNDPEHPEWLSQPLPYDPTITQATDAAYIVAHGVLLGKGTSGSNTKTVYAIAKNPNTFIWHEYGGWNAFTTTLGGYIRMVFRTGNNVDAYVSITTSNTNFYNTYGVYYGSATRNQSFANMYIPSNTGKSATYIAGTISITTTDYYKLNPGFAVCCFAKYNDENGNVKIIPALISTVEQNTVISTDGTTPASSILLTKMYEGYLFYMRYMITPNDVTVNGNVVPEAILTNYPVLFPAGVFNALFLSDWANIRILESRNPYGEPTSGNAGGDGEDDTGDAIPFSTTPTTSAVSSGFLTLFMPNIITLNSLAGYMWSNPLFDPSAIKKLFADPMDAILSLHIVPVKPSTAGVKTISVAGIATEFSSSYTTEQFVPVNCGSIYIPKKFGSYLDYSPYTQTELFLPFIGFKPVDIDDIQGKTVYLQYQIDILSGACIAELKASMDDANSSVIYSWTGNCAVQIPVTGADFKSAFATAITAAASLGAAVATGGAASPLTVGGLASTAVNSTGLKPRVQRSGAMIGSAGFMGQRTPFIVRSNPSIALPPRQEHFTGYPSFDTLLMSDLTGYNVIDEVHLEGVPATDAEMDEIERLLKGGVIF